MSLPGVSCLCPTFNRAPHQLDLLGEAVESFLRQDYPGPKELVVLNDTPGQELALVYPRSYPNVRVINLGSRLATLGGKRDALVRLAQFDLLCPWDDDDISLPGRLSQAVDRLTRWRIHPYVDHPKVNGQWCAPYWNPRRHWYLPPAGLQTNHSHGIGHNASIYTRDAWKKVGGYPAESGSEDRGMDQRLMALGNPPERVSDDPAEWMYVYRWGVSPTHVSGVANGPPEDPHRPHFELIGRRPIAAGRFEITPAWKIDYAQLCRDYRPAG